MFVHDQREPGKRQEQAAKTKNSISFPFLLFGRSKTKKRKKKETSNNNEMWKILILEMALKEEENMNIVGVVAASATAIGCGRTFFDGYFLYLLFFMPNSFRFSP